MLNLDRMTPEQYRVERTRALASDRLIIDAVAPGAVDILRQYRDGLLTEREALSAILSSVESR